VNYSILANYSEKFPFNRLIGFPLRGRCAISMTFDLPMASQKFDAVGIAYAAFCGVENAGFAR
jgi:hypothetical protein